MMAMKHDMMLSRIFLLFLSIALYTTASSADKGFCYYNVDNSSYSQARYQSEYLIAQNLPGTSGWNTAELYTPLAPDHVSISPAIAAAVATQTKLVIGICTVVDPRQCSIQPEIDALRDSIALYGSNFTNLVEGIIVTDFAITSYNVDGSSIAANISLVRNTLARTALKGVRIGTREYPKAWQYSTMEPIIDVVDFLFVRIYPMIMNTTTDLPSGIAYAKKMMIDVAAVADGKPIWVSTGWPNTGVGVTEQFALGPSVTDAKAYWDDFGCGTLFANNVTTFWGTVEPTGFGDDILDSNNNPVHNLTCPLATTAANGSSAPTSTHTSSAPSQMSSNDSSAETSDGLSRPAQLGIGLGVGLGGGLVALGLLLCYCFFGPRRKSKTSTEYIEAVEMNDAPSQDSRPEIIPKLLRPVVMPDEVHNQRQLFRGISGTLAPPAEPQLKRKASNRDPNDFS